MRNTTKQVVCIGCGCAIGIARRDDKCNTCRKATAPKRRSDLMLGEHALVPTGTHVRVHLQSGGRGPESGVFWPGIVLDVAGTPAVHGTVRKSYWCRVLRRGVWEERFVRMEALAPWPSGEEFPS